MKSHFTVTVDDQGNETDTRVGQIWHVIDAKGKTLGDWLLERKLGPGHFLGRQGEREMEVFSSQLKGIVEEANND